jgi:hypothetical protein
MPEAKEKAYGDQQDMPVKEVVREGETQLVEQQDASYQQQEEPRP